MSISTLSRSLLVWPAPATRALGLFFCGVGALAAFGCSREPDLDEVFAPPRRIGLMETSERPSAERYEFAPGSELEFRVGPRSARARGRVALVGGGLSIDSFDLASTRGHAIFDLRTVELENDAPAGARNAHGSSPATSGPSPERSPETAPGSLTERALAWLEVDGAHANARPEHRYARFSLRSLGGPGASSAAEGERLRSEASRPRRRVRLVASGELELHGVRLPYTAPIDATFEWHMTDPASSNPSRIELATREAVGVDLETHAVVPRRSGGEIDAEALSELRKGSGMVLAVTARWVAVPAAAAAGP